MTTTIQGKRVTSSMRTITDLASRTEIKRIEFIDERGLLLLYLNGVWTSFMVVTPDIIKPTYLAVKINGCLALMIDTNSSTICINPIKDFFKSI
jgi:hypothetical protein